MTRRWNGSPPSRGWSRCLSGPDFQRQHLWPSSGGHRSHRGRYAADLRAHRLAGDLRAPAALERVRPSLSMAQPAGSDQSQRNWHTKPAPASSALGGQQIGRRCLILAPIRSLISTPTDLTNAGEVDLVFDAIGGDIRDRSTALVRAGGTLVTIAGPPSLQPKNGRALFFIVEADRNRLTDLAQRLQGRASAHHPRRGPPPRRRTFRIQLPAANQGQDHHSSRGRQLRRSRTADSDSYAGHLPGQG